MARLIGFYLLNLVVYAGPLTLAGFGLGSGGESAPPVWHDVVGPFVDDPTGAYRFVVALAVNSAYLLALSALTFVTFHMGVLLARSSRGVLQSLHTIVYSTGIYLALIFTLAWYLSTADSVAVADDLLIALQSEFVYFVIDLVDVNLALPGGRPEPVDPSRLTLQGKLAIAGLVLSMLYYGYVLYLGARINHRADKLASLIAVLFVAVSPALYVVGSITVVLVLDSTPI